MSGAMWFVIPGAVVAILVYNLFKQFAADRLESLTARLRGSSRLVSQAEFVDGNRRQDVALALTDSSIIYESSDGQSSFDRQWIQEVEYETELATGRSIGDRRVMRLRCFSKTFEFVLSQHEVRRWEALLPPHRILAT